MTPTDLAWAAGFFDGEGSIYIARTGFYRERTRVLYRLEVTVSQVDPRPLERLCRMFGGNIMVTGNPKHRAWAKWRVHNHRAVWVLRLLLPYLLNKREEAELATTFGALLAGRGRIISDAQRAEQEAVRDALMEHHRTDLSAAA